MNWEETKTETHKQNTAAMVAEYERAWFRQASHLWLNRKR